MDAAHMEEQYNSNFNVFTGAVDSTDRINFSNQQLYSAEGRECFPPAYRQVTVCVILFMLIFNVNMLM